MVPPPVRGWSCRNAEVVLRLLIARFAGLHGDAADKGSDAAGEAARKPSRPVSRIPGACLLIHINALAGLSPHWLGALSGMEASHRPWR